MTVVIVAEVGSEPVSRAFREETSDVILVPLECQQIDRDISSSATIFVLPATSSAAPTARSLQLQLGLPDALGTLPLDAAEQRLAVGSTAQHGPRFSAAFVSRAGAHASAGVYEELTDGSSGESRPTGCVSVLPGSPLAEQVRSAAVGYLEHFGVRDGATSVQVELCDHTVQLMAIEPTVPELAPPVDASFTAFGHSHAHLLAESVLRPSEFDRRLVRPLQPGRTTLAVAALRTSADELLHGAGILRTVRRLTGFHSATRDPGADVTKVAFVHPDRASVVNSLTIISEMEHAGIAFVEDYQIIGLAPTAS